MSNKGWLILFGALVLLLAYALFLTPNKEQPFSNSKTHPISRPIIPSPAAPPSTPKQNETKNGAQRKTIPPSPSTAVALKSSIEGIVRDQSSGQALANCKVVLDYELGQGAWEIGPELRSDDQGRFHIDSVRSDASAVLISFRLQDYGRESRRLPLLSEGEKRWVEVALSPAINLNGKIFDDLGNVLKDVSVSLQDQAAFAVLGQTRSNEKGEFAFADLSLTSIYAIVCEKPGFKTERIEALRADEKIEIQMQRELSISGIVRSKNSQPVPHFSIQLVQESNLGVIENERAEEFHSPDGAFVIENVIPGNWTLIASAESFSANRLGPFSLLPGTKRSFLFELTPGRTIRGFVLGEASESAVSAQVWQAYRSKWNQFSGVIGEIVKTDEAGNFELQGMPFESFTLRIRSNKYADAVATVPASTESLFELTPITLQRGARIEGSCWGPNGEVLKGFVIDVIPGEMQDATTRVIADSKGQYSIESVAAGEVELVGFYPGSLPGISPTHRFHRRTKVENRQNARIDFDCRNWSSVRGKAIDYPVGKSENWTVHLRHVGIENGGLEGSSVLNSKGEYEIYPLSQGEYQLWLNSNEELRAIGTFSLAESERKSLDFEIGLAKISGTVFDKSGNAVLGITVAATRKLDSGQDGETVFTSSDAQGNFHFDRLRSGNYRILFQGADEKQSHQENIELLPGEARSLEVHMRN